MNFEDQVKAHARRLGEEKKAQKAEQNTLQKQAEAQFLHKCQAAWDQAIGGDWPPVEWTIYAYGSGIGGFGSFKYKRHTWYVTPNFQGSSVSWTWHESSVNSPLLHSTSSSQTLRDDLLTALVNPPKRPTGFQPFD